MSEKDKEKEKEKTTDETEVTVDPKNPDKVIRVEHTFNVKKEPVEGSTTPKESKEEKTDDATTPKVPESKDGEDLVALKKEKEALEAEINKLKEDEANPELEGSKANISRKLEERTNALAVIATQEFEVEKKKLLDEAKKGFEASNTPKEEMDKKLKEIDEKIDDPTMLETVKTTMAWLMPPKVEEEDEGLEKVPPSGKARAQIPEDVYKDHKQVIDDICVILDDPTKSHAEKAEAEKKWNELFFELYKGMKQARAVTPTFSFTTCPRCNTMIPTSGYKDDVSETCPNCGWKQQVPRVRR